MSVKLIVEVLDHWQDAGLTRGERDDLLLIAENANDISRETFSPMHEDYILRRAGKKAESWRNAIDALKRKGVLEYARDDHGRQIIGRLGQYAKYRIPVLCPDPPHDGYKGQCTRAEKRVTSQVTQDDRVTPEMTQEGHLPDDPSNRLGHPTGDVCVTPQMTPTPLNPSSKNTPQEPPPPAAAPSAPSAGSEGVVVQEEGEENRQDARKRAEAFVEGLPFLNPPNRGRKQRLQTQVAHALAAGWSEGGLMAICEDSLSSADDRVNCWLYRLKPDQLGPAPKAGQDDPEISRVPKPRQESGGHRTWSDPDSSTYRPPKREHVGWQNPTDPDAYEGTF